MTLSEADVKQLSEQLETVGWRSRDINGLAMWTLRGFEGAYSLVEAHGFVCAGWAAQRLADLVKPWYRDRTVWLTLASMFGGVGTAVATELAGSQNHVLSALGLAIGAAAPFLGNYVNQQARQAAVLDMRKADDFWAAQPPPQMPPRPQQPPPGPVEPPR